MVRGIISRARLVSIALSPQEERVDSYVFTTEPVSGTQAHRHGSLYIVIETAQDSTTERSLARRAAQEIQRHYYRSSANTVDDALYEAVKQAHEVLRTDPTLPPINNRPPLALIVFAIRNGEFAACSFLPVQMFLMHEGNSATIPDEPFWLTPETVNSERLLFGESPDLLIETRTATLSSGDTIAVCSSLLAQSVDTSSLFRAMATGEPETVRSALTSSYRGAAGPAYALLVTLFVDARMSVFQPSPAIGFASAWLDRFRAWTQQLSQTTNQDRRTVSSRSRRPSIPPRRVRRAQPPTRRMTGWLQSGGSVIVGTIALVVIVVLLGALIISKGFQAFQAHQQAVALQQVTASVNRNMQQAQRATDPAVRLEDIDHAIGIVQQQQKRLTPAAYASLLTQLQHQRELVGHSITLTHFTRLVDLSKDPAASQIHLSRIVLASGIPYVLDTGVDRILQISVAQVKAIPVITAQAVIGTTTVQPLVAITAEGANILAIDSHNNVWRYSPATHEVQQVLVPGANAWGSALAATIANNDLFVLDTHLNRIWEYPPAGSGYGTPIDFFGAIAAKSTPTKTPSPQPNATVTPAPQPTPFVPPDLHHAADIAYDGSLYILQSDGQIQKYTNGVRQPFPEQGLVGPLENSTRIIVPSESAGVFVVDPAGTRIVHFTASGQYDGQYFLPVNINTGINKLLDAAYDPQTHQFYLLADKSVSVATIPSSAIP
ncbi:MAG: hypothetical protein M1396_00935 [Chloroflexi bacterium]|nr:hypothetical protein [Chloroflexota bacterium]